MGLFFSHLFSFFFFFFLFFSFSFSYSIQKEILEMKEKMPVGHRYILENECTETLKSELTVVPPEFQQDFFDLIALNISDLRMLPYTCRRPAIWMFCSLAFPIALDPAYDETNDICIVGLEECEFVSESCDGALDCSELEDFFSPESDSGLCPRLEDSVDFPVEVQTCLKKQGKTIECCFEPFVKAEATGECVLSCPAGLWDQGDLATISYVLLGLGWFSVIVHFIGVFPLFFLEEALKYPKAFVPMGLICVVLWNMTKLWGVYVGIDDYVCNGEEDGIIAFTEFANSPTCAAQLFFLNLFPVTISGFMVVISLLFLVMVSKPNSPKLPLKLRPFCYFLLIVPPLVVSLTITLLIELDDQDHLVILSFANSCQTDVTEGVGQLLLVYYTVFFGTTYILSFLAVVKVFMVSRHLFRVYIQSVVFLALMTFNTALLLVLFYHYLPDEQDSLTDYEEGLVCVASHPREEDAGCQTQFTDNFPFFVFVEFSLFIGPSLTVIGVFWNDVTFTWWKELVFRRKVIRGAHSLRSTRSHNSSGHHGSNNSNNSSLEESHSNNSSNGTTPMNNLRNSGSQSESRLTKLRGQTTTPTRPK